jgi:hypothetical protein
MINKRLGKSFSLQPILSFSPSSHLISLQLVSKRFYRMFTIYLIKKLKLWAEKAFNVKIHDDKLDVLKGVKWTKFAVVEEGWIGAGVEYFEEKLGGASRMFINSKIIQVNSRDVYVIGGKSKEPSLLRRYYQVDRSCLKIDLKTGKL